MTAIKVDGNPALLTTKCPFQPATAFVGLGDRMYVFSVSDRNAVELLDAFLKTVRLPGTCASLGCTVAPAQSIAPG